MPVLILKALDCNLTHSLSVDSVRLDIDPDLAGTTKIKRTMNNRSRAAFSGDAFHFPFDEEVAVTLFTAGTIQLGETLHLSAFSLVDQVESGFGRHRGRKEFKEATARYTLWFEVIPDGVKAVDFHDRVIPRRLPVRRFLGSTGRGVLTQSVFDEVTQERRYRCQESLLLRRVLDFHTGQDGGRGDGVSLRRWIEVHCNAWGERSVIPVEDLPTGPEPIALLSKPSWRPVRSEASVTCAGFCVSSTMSGEDNPSTHMSRDWVFDLVPAPAFHYLLAYTARTADTATGVQVPKIHNEWESGSMPTEWRPERGEFVTIHGRHVFDLGHMPMRTEIHPVHTIVRERTVGQVNRAVVGMGLSGGFPGSIEAELQGELDERWQREFDGFPHDVSLRNRRCWVTNLKRHPLRHQLFPPDKEVFPPDQRPPAGAEPFAKVVDWRLIHVSASRLNEFLNASKGQKVPQTDKVNLKFSNWFAEGLTDRPAGLKPRLHHRDSFVELEVDLSGVEDIPVAYHAEVECRWV